MAEVNVTINGRTYGIACDDGQEQRVLDLGKYVDERLREISRAGAASSESHLMVLTSLVLADEIFDLLESEGGAKTGKTNGSGAISLSKDDEKKFISAIDHLASRIDSIAGNLQKAS